MVAVSHCIYTVFIEESPSSQGLEGWVTPRTSDRRKVQQKTNRQRFCLGTRTERYSLTGTSFWEHVPAKPGKDETVR
jgi:hypothetical protein